MTTARGARGPLAALAILALILPFSTTDALADSGATVPSGFRDEALLTGLVQPMAIVFAPNGNVFVAEKRGTIQFYSNISDTTPTLFADLSTNVHNYWDRGLMGLAVDPGYPARPYVYVLYAYNHILGDPAPAPRWPSADADVPPGSPFDDRCPNPPGSSTDGCVISGRLSRLTVSGGVMSGPEHVLVEDWCQQFPSHSVGSLMFGPEGALYASAGEGANFFNADYGQFGGSSGSPTPLNPCGDPPGGAGASLTAPSAEGGSLRSQDLRTTGDLVQDPVGLDGSIIRIEPDTGLAWPTNANALAGSTDANARRIVAYGLRNPFRLTVRPGTGEIWIGDVGNISWEEVDRLADPSAAPANFGWPCWEGPAPQGAYVEIGLTLCDQLSANAVTLPYMAYKHYVSVSADDGCGTGSSSISGLAFLSASSGYPDSYDGSLFFTDYARRCIWVMPAGAGGLPDPNAVTLFANLDRASDPDGGAVFLTMSADGDLVYADYDRGEIRRIHYYVANEPPVATFTATPSTGTAPLDVAFDAGASSDANHDNLTFAWDLDGDGQYDDATGVTASHTYDTMGNVDVGLKVTDSGGLSDTTTRTLAVDNGPPQVTIDSPPASLTWKVGDAISFSGTATDPEDGTLPPSAFQWTLTMRHCPSDCHSHIIQTFTGVAAGTFDAPAHDYPSHLLLSVVVTDSNGSTATNQLELYPKTGTISTDTSPAGIATRLGEVTAVNPTATGIVGVQMTVTAPATQVIGEGTWSFRGWSDGGARSHTVLVTEEAQHVTATYALTATTDASGTCAGAGAAVTPSGQWQTGKFGTAADVDWYRFKLTSTTRVRLVLGDLSVPAKMSLYQGCTKLLQSSDRAGLRTEEIDRTLPAGTYAVRLSGQGSPTAAPDAFLMQKLGSGVRVLSQRSLAEGSSIRFVGEVYNNTSRTVGRVIVTARLYDKWGRLLATRSASTLLPYVPSHTRAPFNIAGSRPAGYDHVLLSVSAPTTSRSFVDPSRTVTTSAPDPGGHWVVAGSVKDQLTTRVGTLAIAVTLYDGRGRVLDVARASVGTTILSPGHSTAFRATIPSTGLVPDRVVIRGMMAR
jgi:PKD repeat protein/glucose/arabinose dehydrogenase